MPDATVPRAARREINLLDRTSAQPRPSGLPAWWPGATAGVALGVCLVISVVQAVQNHRLERAARAEQAALTAAQSADPGAVSPEEEASLSAELAQLTEQVLRLRGARPPQVVSALLGGLADATLDGVWLTRIRVDHDRGVLALEGLTRDAKLIPDYLAALGRQPALAGVALNKVSVKQGEPAAGEAPPALEFQIESEPIGGAAPSRVQRVEAP